jgi:hypothetical protein
MKKIIRFSWIHPAIWAALCSILLSFSFKPGAHSFQIYLDSKLVLDQYVNSKMEIPTLRLDPDGNYNQLIVKYNECGRTVSGRTITIKDENDKILKEWRFEGMSSGYKESMVCQVKEIIALTKKETTGLKLYYSSNDFHEGQQIARLIIGRDPKTALNK